MPGAKYYVYVYYDLDRATPRWVGAGSGNRDKGHLRVARRLMDRAYIGNVEWYDYLNDMLSKEYDSSYIARIAQGLSRREVLTLEEVTIKQLDRMIDGGGTLFNLMIGKRWPDNLKQDREAQLDQRISRLDVMENDFATAQRKADQVRALDAEGVDRAEIARRLGIGRTSVYRVLGLAA